MEVVIESPNPLQALWGQVLETSFLFFFYLGGGGECL